MALNNRPENPRSSSSGDSPLLENPIEYSGVEDTSWRSLREYTRAHTAKSNDCAWLHQFVAFDAISNNIVEPLYQVRVYYQGSKSKPTIFIQDFNSTPSDRHDLKRCLISKYIRAVILRHRDSSQVDPHLIDLLWSELDLEISFLRHHFDYKNFRYEKGCPTLISKLIEHEDSRDEDYWTWSGRWNPIRLPSETCASVLRLTLDSECLSVSCKGGVGK
jgi:hypothetical protein